ncbi:Uma2 family endonuclease [Leptolyngbya sp. KIOST-1]|uniref:Uma2 family endonuclease n=1 Tax=Leptolyngbya sp. KIOST-1 TaxID=1229172 RepID=UPI00298E7C29|nr:Uma2 family endonuclease [Leptolyngbya sp. KIOST-1]
MIAVPNYISADEYLDLERQSNLRHEYRRGLVYAMAGGTDNHDRIAFNLLKLIDNHLGDIRLPVLLRQRQGQLPRRVLLLPRCLCHLRSARSQRSLRQALP